MSNGIADSAVGAILEIPPQTLQDIDKAERAIKQLALTSAEAAGKVNDHWGVVAPNGLQKFIDKIAEAKKTMDGLGSVNINLNVGGAKTQMDTAVNVVKSGADNISETLQRAAQTGWDSLNQNKRPAFLDALNLELTSIQEVEHAIKQLKKTMITLDEPTGKGLRAAAFSYQTLIEKQQRSSGDLMLNRQQYADVIGYLEKMVALWQETESAKNKALSNIQQKQQDQTDKNILSEQNQLLADRLKYQKKLNELESTEKTRTAKKGTGLTADESKQMDVYARKIDEINQKLVELSGKYGNLSEQGREAWRTNRIDNLIAKQEANIRLTEKESEALARIKKEQESKDKSAQDKTDKNILDEQKRLLTEQLNLRKRISDQKKIVESGNITDSSKLKEEEDALRKLAEQYRKNAEARMDLNRENLSTTGQTKFDLAEEKQRNELLDIRLKKQRELNSALAKANEYTSVAQVGKSRIDSSDEGRTLRQLNSDYKGMINVIREVGEIRAKAAAEGRSTNTEERELIATLIQRYRLYRDDIARISSSYANLAEARRKAYEQDHSEQLARNAVMLADAQQKAAGSTNHLVAEYKKLYAEYQSLNKSLDLYNSKIAGTPQTPASMAIEAKAQDIANRMGALQTRMAEIERKNIQEVADFRMQKDMEANQRSISEFVQAEAQKRAEAQKTLEENVAKARQAAQQYVQSYAGAMAQYNNMMSGRAGGKLTDTYDNRARVIKNLEAAIRSLDKADADYERKLKELTDALNKLKSAQKEVTDAMKPTKPMVSPQDAINAAKNATTLKQLQDAYKQLKEVMAATDPKSQAWSQMNSQLQKTKTHIDEIKKKMGEFQSQASKTSGLMGQLQGRIAAAFSIGAISGFIKKMVDVRAQFELQRVALGAIIQDRDEANKIFTQVQNMALESPFNIMQLEKATKQIAAFGFETKKLVPTMKMFADISAGLGVEIDRLVLVMGHLKARNFLEGTMVRQFTNMGFNVLGELSKYYSELENKMVSVGEVQDRVKKKMVSFEDVEEVLKRVTSAGGMFYDMQKKQSESLWGQLQRIQDAYDLMLNDIGQSNESILKSALTFIRSLINHWRLLAPIIVTITGLMAAAFSVKAIMFMIGGIKNLNAMLAATALRLRLVADAQRAASFASWGTGIGLVIGLLGTLAGVMAGVRMEQNALNEELGRIEKEGVGNMYNLIFQYRQLADTVKDTNATYDERNKALEEIKRVYKDILPDQMLEIDNIKQMKNGYEDATKAIQAYYSEKIKQQKRESVETNYGKKLKETIEDDAEMFATRTLLLAKTYAPGMSKDVYTNVVRNIMTPIIEEVKNGDKTMDEAKAEFEKQFIATFNIDKEALENLKSSSQVYADIFDAVFSATVKKVDAMQKDLGLITDLGLPGVTLENKEAKEAVDNYESLEKAVNDYKIALQNLREEKEKGNIEGDIMWGGEDGFYAEATNKLGQSALDALTNAWSDVWHNMDSFDKNFIVTMDDINTAMQSQIDMSVYFEKVNEQTFGSVLANWKTWGKELINNNYFANFIERMMDKRRELDLSDEQKQIRNLIKEVGDLNNVDLSKYKWALIDSKDNVASVAKEVKSEVESLKNSIEKYQAAVAAGLPAIIAQAWFLGGKTLDEIQQTMKAVDELSHKMGNADKSSKGGKGKDPWQDRLSLFKEINTEYEKLLKNYSEEEAKQRIQLSYAKAVAEIFKGQGKFGDINNWLGFDKESMIEMGQQMLDTLKISPEKRKDMEKQLAGLKAEVDVHFQEDAVERMKKDIQSVADNFELTDTFMKLGVNTEMVFSLGGKPTTLEDYKRHLIDTYEQTFKIEKKYGEDGAKAYDELLKQVAQKEQKQLEERAKNYAKYLQKMYSDRAKAMIDSYATMSMMEQDFQKQIEKLQSEMIAPDTTEVRKKELAGMIDSLTNQMSEVARGIRDELSKNLAKQDWNDFKSSEIFTQMYQDVSMLSGKAIDTLIERLKAVRKNLQSLSDVDPKAVREVTSYIQKLQKVKDEQSPFKMFTDGIATIKALKKEYKTLEDAQVALVDKNNAVLSDKKEIADLETIIGLKDKEGGIEAHINQLTESQRGLYEANKDALDEALESARAKLEADQKSADTLADQLDKSNKTKDALEKQVSLLNEMKEGLLKCVNASFEIAEAFGADIDDEWKNLTTTLVDATFQAITLTLQFQLMGIALNSALGIIGWVAIALQVVASLLTAIFAAKDKSLQKKIEGIQDRVDTLSKSFEKLEKSIERAFSIGIENRLTEDAIDNLEEQKRAYQEMIRLEEAKKKTDDDKIKEYKDKLEELAEAEEELYEKRHEKWGSTNDVWDEANNWVDAWLDAYKETGDGLDALNDSWDEFYENLVKKQAASKVLGARMDGWIKQINDAIDKNMGSEYDYIDLFKQIGEKMKADFDATNADLKKIFEYAGIGGGAGSLILSDLQKGIQNITEPQAAAIEAYLNSMRFAVFHHTEQLDTLIATIQKQYGSGAENPVVTELKGIRSVLDSINSKFDSIIGKNGFQSAIRIVS